MNDLSELRTPMPLRDADFAAVRARVLSEIGQRKQRSWWFAFRFAAAVAMLIVALNVHETKPPVSTVHVASQSTPIVSITSIPQSPTPKLARHTRKPRVHKRTRIEPTTVSRIEIHTADPDVRIIWIVPKENS